MKEITHVKKRNGEIVSFDIDRIARAVDKAFESVETINPDLIDDLTQQIKVVIFNKFEGVGIPSVEEIQDIVEIILINNNLPEIAKNYILYRHERSKLRQTTTHDIEALISN